MTLPKPPSLRCLRSFSTTLPMPKPTTHSPVPRYTKGPPPYPYGPTQHYKQSDSGLYGGASIQFGNKVSEKNAHKSRRAWRPNIHNKRLWSDGLGRFVQVKVQARVLRTIDKCGGLDEYLLGEKPGRVKELGVEGWRLRWLVMRTGKVRRRIKGEREALGLPATTQKRKARADALDDEVERASGEVVEQIEGANAGLSEAEDEETFVVPPSSAPTALQDHINRTTQAIEAETAAEALRQAQKTKPSLPANALPSQTDESEEEDNPAKPPSRRSTKGEKRVWRAEQTLDSDHEAEFATEGALALRAEVARIEEVVGAEMEELAGEGRDRLEEAMERLRGASEELERVKAEAWAAEKEKEQEQEREAEGGILGKIKGLFGRR